MPGAVRLLDLCTGHACYPPRPNIQASTDVFVNSRGWHRKADRWMAHCCYTSCHDSQTSEGSKSVYVNLKRVARIGDSICCGSKCLLGSNDVFAGNSGEDGVEVDILICPTLV